MTAYMWHQHRYVAQPRFPCCIPASRIVCHASIVARRLQCVGHLWILLVNGRRGGYPTKNVSDANGPSFIDLI